MRVNIILRSICNTVFYFNVMNWPTRIIMTFSVRDLSNSNYSVALVTATYEGQRSRIFVFNSFPLTL